MTAQASDGRGVAVEPDRDADAVRRAIGADGRIRAAEPRDQADDAFEQRRIVQHEFDRLAPRRLGVRRRHVGTASLGTASAGTAVMVPWLVVRSGVPSIISVTPVPEGMSGQTFSLG